MSRTPKKPTEVNLRKLVDYKVLPYLDLKLWEEVNKKKIKKSVLCAALFPNGEKGDAELSEQVQTLAEASVKNSFINSLSIS